MPKMEDTFTTRGADDDNPDGEHDDPVDRLAGIMEEWSAFSSLLEDTDPRAADAASKIFEVMRKLMKDLGGNPNF